MSRKKSLPVPPPATYSPPPGNNAMGSGANSPGGSMNSYADPSNASFASVRSPIRPAMMQSNLSPIASVSASPRSGSGSSRPALSPTNSQRSKESRRTGRSASTGGINGGAGNAAQASFARRPGLYSSDSTCTLVGSTLERKIADGNADLPRVRTATGARLEELRTLMLKDKLDY